jgi:hypothetical protein
MSQESISFFEDKTTEQIINWMIAHLSESQLRSCLDSADIRPGYSAGPSSSTAIPSSSAVVPSSSTAIPSSSAVVPSSSGAGPSSSGAGSSSLIPSSSGAGPSSSQSVPQFTPPVGAQSSKARVPFNIAPYIDTLMGQRQIGAITPEILVILKKYVGFQIESKEQIKKAFPAVDAAGLSAVPVYIYDYEPGNSTVYFLGIEARLGNLIAVPYRAPDLKTFKLIGVELLDKLNKNILSSQYILPTGSKLTSEIQKVVTNYTDGDAVTINLNIKQVLQPNYIKEIRAEIAAMRASNFGFTDNYFGGELFDDLNEESINYNFGQSENNFGQSENDYEQSENNYGEESEYTETVNGSEDINGSESGTFTENDSEADFGEPEKKVSSKNIRVYDMTPEQLNEHMTNKFGAKFAQEYTPVKYVNSNGIPAVKYLLNQEARDNNAEMQNESDEPIISGFGEESEEENLF